MGRKVRLDLLLVEKNYFASREKARAAIMAGDVQVNGASVTKPGQQVDEQNQCITVREKMPYVSRGGYKLARALQSFNIDLRNRLVLDVGASTGGFTDCALQNGAAIVYAVDVGYGQMAWLLRTDQRVVVLERTNIRNLEQSIFTRGKPDFVTIDVAFISLTLVLPRIAYLLDYFECVALVKPQFEAGRELVGKKGVVRDPTVHKQVLVKVAQTIAACGAVVLGADFSPLKGPEGNIEYLVHCQKNARSTASGTAIAAVPEAVGRETGELDKLFNQVVETAHQIADWPYKPPADNQRTVT